MSPVDELFEEMGTTAYELIDRQIVEVHERYDADELAEASYRRDVEDDPYVAGWAKNRWPDLEVA
jgi:hypothetical protein